MLGFDKRLIYFQTSLQYLLCSLLLCTITLLSATWNPDCPVFFMSLHGQVYFIIFQSGFLLFLLFPTIFSALVMQIFCFLYTCSFSPPYCSCLKCIICLFLVLVKLLLTRTLLSGSSWTYLDVFLTVGCAGDNRVEYSVWPRIYEDSTNVTHIRTNETTKPLSFYFPAK